ncbi:energy-coupling factor ABC transporter ATP-binding protein [candidate division WOR-3 bacterium RBG_13_43_14]|uniref:Energy-coupling factor ABC transporter ATP-binding protein n=1 Tax=candidate division WOR-3 bacterium RBG_13_43_14 TaxID=1802590 RepID=A0A1F4UAD0_UNCW3|nr:MAG: energy-coupling factor ABC transporter ATP-binding protein [candidate division WOR-3 bacterium RBG_13_43_14]
MDENIIIDIKRLSFGYPGKPELLDKFELRVKKGERLGIIGPNGCGKTTVFYLIMGLLKALHGTINILGRERSRENDFIEVRANIGFLFQDSDNQLFCPSIEEEIAFGPLNFGYKGHQVKDMIKEVLNTVGLDGYEKRIPYTLSGGEKRRLALATILVMKPKILLLDEPENGLDEDAVDKFVEILQEPGLSYIIISQNRDFLKRTTNTLYTIKQGRAIMAK